MPTFFFDVYDGNRAIADEFGTESESIEEAAQEAAALLPSFAIETIPAGQTRDFAAAVRDQSGEVVYRAVLLFRGQFIGQDRPAIEGFLSSDNYHAARSVALREEAKALGEKLSKGAAELLASLEAAKATVNSMRSARENDRREAGSAEGPVPRQLC
jgi:hypothetical protein